MKIQRKCLQNLVLDGEVISGFFDFFLALRDKLTVKFLDELLDLYQKGDLSLWLRYHEGADIADWLRDNITLSGNKVDDLYQLCNGLGMRLSFKIPSGARRLHIAMSDIFDIMIGELVLDGEKINSVEELTDHPSTEFLELYQTGTLSTWLRAHNGESQANNLDELTLSGDKAEDLHAVCLAIGIGGITLEDIRNALEQEGESQEQPVESSVEQYK